MMREPRESKKWAVAREMSAIPFGGLKNRAHSGSPAIPRMRFPISMESGGRTAGFPDPHRNKYRRG